MTPSRPAAIARLAASSGLAACRRLAAIGGLALLTGFGSAHAAELPEQIRQSGTLRLTVNGTYAPREYHDPQTNELKGLDIDSRTRSRSGSASRSRSATCPSRS